jgi:hypothetical protein
MKILHLTLKKQWFDMIASGEKKEEYREIKPYWVSRLVQSFFPEKEERDYTFYWKGMLFSMDEPVAYDVIEFRNGYSKDAPKMIVECKGIENGYSKIKWSGEHKPCFIIKLGEILPNHSPER